MGKFTRRGDFRVDPYENYPLMGQLVLTNTGTVYQFPAEDGVCLTISPHPMNTGTVWVGHSPNVNDANGYPLAPFGSGLTLDGLADMALLYAVADYPGDKVCWLLQVGFSGV